MPERASMADLTRIQRRVLTYYVRWRSQRLTLTRILLQTAPSHLLRLVVFVASVWLALRLGAADNTLVGASLLLAAGMMLGATVQYVTTARHTVEFWPLLMDLLNWERVDDLLHGRADGPASLQAQQQLPPPRESDNPFQSPSA